MNEFYHYADKIIAGVINTYRFTRFAEWDELVQEARIAIILAINKNQFNENKGTMFNFLSIVIARNLYNFTKKSTRYYKKKSSADIDVFFNNESLVFNQDYDQNFILDDILNLLIDFFDGKPRFIKLSYLLVEYFQFNRSSRFIKKHFIQFAKGHNFSSAMVNTFFDFLQRSKHQKPEIKNFLNHVQNDYDVKISNNYDIKKI